jgi:hypothetical protein
MIVNFQNIIVPRRLLLKTDLRGKLKGGTMASGLPVGMAFVLGGGCDVSVTVAIASCMGRNGCCTI